MGSMNIYLISQEENDDYDTYDSAVVCAPDEETARNMNPSTGEPTMWEKTSQYSGWARSSISVKVRFLGVSDEGLEPGVICSSFHAG